MLRPVALVLGATLTLVSCGGGGEGAVTTQASAPETTSTSAPPPPPPTTPEEEFADPTKDDFSLDLKTLEKQCFGSAGCNVTVRVELGYGGLYPLDPSKTYEITYEIRGGEDGASINTLEASGEDYSRDEEEYVSTSSSKTKLKAVITEVEEG